MVNPAGDVGNAALPLMLGNRYQLRSAEAQHFSQFMASQAERPLLRGLRQYAGNLTPAQFESMMGRGSRPWIFGNDALANARMAAMREMVGPTTSYADFQRGLANYDRLRRMENAQRRRDPTRAYARATAALMGAQGLQQVGTGLTNMGYENAGGIVSGVATIGTSAGAGAAAGAALGSVIPGLGTAAGAGIGAIIGTLTGTVEALGNQAKDATSKIENLAKSIEQIRDVRTKMYGIIDKFVKTTRFEDWQKSLESESEDDLVRRKYRKEREIARAKEDRTALATSIPQERWTEY